jgi:tRNA-dihydrouridine synthase A
MIGRAAYHNPYFLAELDEHLQLGVAKPNRHDVVQQMLPYIESELAAGERLHRITRHMTGLFLGQPGAKAWRRYLSENACLDNAGVDVLVDALQQMPMAA